MFFKYARRAVETAIISSDFRNRNVIRGYSGIYSDQSVFLLGNAPSLLELPIKELVAHQMLFMTVNNGPRLFKGLPIPFHIVSDPSCFANNYTDWAETEIGHAFYRKKFRKKVPEACELLRYNITWVPYRNGGIIKRGVQSSLHLGIGNDSSVLSFAAQICLYLGFQKIYVLGCDLSYLPGQEYAYDMNDQDVVHEQSAETKEKRLSIHKTEVEFGILNRVFIKNGKSIYNCGIGGNLNSVPRMPFELALDSEISKREKSRVY